MPAATTAYRIAEAQGWSDTTLLDLCLSYIANQQDDPAFEEYLAQIAAEENTGTEDDFAFEPEDTGEADDIVGACILTPENMGTEDDCTAHDHQPGEK